MGTSKRSKALNARHLAGWLEAGITRRAFMRTTGALAAGAAFGCAFFRENPARAVNFGNPVLVDTDQNVEVKYSLCGGCEASCGMRCKIVDGILVKIDGNPYHPSGMMNDDGTEGHLPYDTPIEEALAHTGALCAKGQAGIATLYSPTRIKAPLKRVGPRGSGQWETISWEQAFPEIAAQLAAHRDLTTNIDDNAPELGPLANRIVFTHGRAQATNFTRRFWGSSFGTVNNNHGPSDPCSASHGVGMALSTGLGYQDHECGASPDLANSDLVLWFGQDPVASGFSMVARARPLVNMLNRGGKLAVVDPRQSVSASKATWWLPIIPGTDAALALMIARYLIDNDLHNVAFLQRPHDGAANPTGELNTTDAALLVKVVDGHAMAHLRADEAGIVGGTQDDFVVWSGGEAVQYNSVDTGDLLPGEVTVNGFTCKTAFELYVDQVQTHTLEEWSSICGLDVTTIQAVAVGLASHGRRVAVCHSSGSSEHTNGTFTAWAIACLNHLLGGYNWKGGLHFGGGSYDGAGGVGTSYRPEVVHGGVQPSGIQINRIVARYENTSEYAGKPPAERYPAPRPWFPMAIHGNAQELIPSIDDAYPYSIAALINCAANIPYSTPAGKAAFERVVADEKKVPLFVSIDSEMSEMTGWADYVLPETTYFERWGDALVGRCFLTRACGFQVPVVGTFDGDGNYTPVLPNTKTTEDILIGLGKALGLPLGSEDALGDPVPINRAQDYWIQRFHNIADQDGGPGLDHALARGGRFEAAANGYEGDMVRHRWGARLFFFNETLSQMVDSMTGERFDGFPKYQPVADLLDQPIADDPTAFPLALITYTKAWHNHDRTAANPLLMSIQPENFVEINTVDAQARGIRTGDEVLVSSASHPDGSHGIAWVTATVRPGVVAISRHFGHWGLGSQSYSVNGVVQEAAKWRGHGIASNPIMRGDPVKPNVTLQDKLGGSPSSFDTRVQVAKV